MSGAQHWELDGVFGREAWTRQDGSFASVAVGTGAAQRLVLADGSFELDMLALRQGRCAHPGPWPNAFRFCPDCGAALAEPAALQAAADWSAPSGALSGLPVLPASDLAPVGASRRQEGVPGGANLGFVVAGTPPHLFAYDIDSGVLHARREADAQWQEVARLARAHDLPRWSWSAAVLPSDGPPGSARGFVVATNDGPVLVRHGPSQRTEIARPPNLGILRAAGGVALIRGRAAMPVWMVPGQASSLGLACLSAEGVWSVSPVRGAPEPGTPRTPFAVATVHGDAFWCGAAGLLSVGEADGVLQPEYRPWPAGLSPVLGVRPLQSESGVLYQLMRHGPDLPVFRSLTLPDREPEERPFRLCLSSGNAVFVDGKRRRLPWDEAGGRGEYTLGEDEFLLPLLAFGERRFLVAICAGRITLSGFVATDAEAAGSRGCRLAFTPFTRTLVPLDRRVDVTHAWDIVPFIFRGRLFVYAAGRNECWSWAMQADGRG